MGPIKDEEMSIERIMEFAKELLARTDVQIVVKSAQTKTRVTGHQIIVDKSAGACKRLYFLITAPDGVVTDRFFENTTHQHVGEFLSYTVTRLKTRDKEHNDINGIKLTSEFSWSIEDLEEVKKGDTK